MGFEIYLFWAVGVLAVGGLPIVAIACFHVDALQRKLCRTLDALNYSMQRSKDIYCELKSDPSWSNSEKCTFENSSLTEYQEAVTEWTQFVGTFALARRKEQHGYEYQTETTRRTLWKRKALLDKALKEICEGPCEGLPARLEAEAEAARKSYWRFKDSIKANELKLGSLKAQISGDDEKSILRLLANLELRGVLHPRYQEAVTKVQKHYEELQSLLMRDPLDPQNSAVAELERKIAKLSSLLRRALSMGDSLQTMRGEICELWKRIESLRRRQLCSTLTKAKHFETGYTLDEPGFEVQSLEDECGVLLHVMDETLASRRLYSFSQAHQALSALTARVNLLLQEIQDDKSFVDEQMKAIKKQSNANDRKAEMAQRAKIYRLYKAQHWHAAMLEVKQLLLEHTPRVQARGQIGSLAEPFSMVLGILQDHPNVVSYELDDALQVIAAEIAALQTQAAYSKADWAALAQKAEELKIRLVGSDTGSLYCRANAEVKAYGEAANELAKLKERVQLLNENLASWCGEEAASKLQELQSPISLAIADSVIGKQDWRLYLARVVETNALLDELTALLQMAWDKHKLHESQIGEFETQLATCLADGAYSRLVCGTKFGAEIYIYVDELEPLLARAKTGLELRDYDSVYSELKQGRAVLLRENLEAWWLSFQLMANSGSACARSFALKQGYTAGGFDLWVQERMQSDEEKLYIPPNPACAHKENVIKVIRSDDSPVTSDYFQLA